MISLRNIPVSNTLIDVKMRLSFFRPWRSAGHSFPQGGCTAPRAYLRVLSSDWPTSRYITLAASVPVSFRGSDIMLLAGISRSFAPLRGISIISRPTCRRRLMSGAARSFMSIAGAAGPAVGDAVVLPPVVQNAATRRPEYLTHVVADTQTAPEMA